jgi:polyhydroxyalkanoate synthesis regulator phasin
MPSKKTSRKASKNVKEKPETLSRVSCTVREFTDHLNNRIGDYSEKYVSPVVDTCKDFYEDLLKDPRKRIGEMVGEGIDWAGDIRSDTREQFSRFASDGKRYVKKIDIMETIEKTVQNGLHRLNLASRKDIDGLGKAIASLNRKVSRLNKKHSV